MADKTAGRNDGILAVLRVKAGNPFARDVKDHRIIQILKHSILSELAPFLQVRDSDCCFRCNPTDWYIQLAGLHRHIVSAKEEVYVEQCSIHLGYIKSRNAVTHDEHNENLKANFIT